MTTWREMSMRGGMALTGSELRFALPTRLAASAVREGGWGATQTVQLARRPPP